MKRYILSVITALSLVVIPTATTLAQTVPNETHSAVVAPVACVNLTLNLRIGTTREDVRDLKNFLQVTGLYNVTYVKNGNFKNNIYDLPTKRAVMAWQSRMGISPALGFVGPKTRVALRTLTCTVTTPKSADVNGDGKVTTADLTLVGNLINTNFIAAKNNGAQTNNPQYDLNNDGKVDLADLAIVNAQIPTNIRADVNSDGMVNSKDIMFFNTFIGTSIGDEYTPADDMNADGKVDAQDIALFKADYDLVVKPIIMPAIVGDVNNDGVINQKDIDLVKAAINTSNGDANFNPAADVNGDGHITITDVAIVKLKVQMQAADLNNDGKVTTADITILGNALNAKANADKSNTAPYVLDSKYDLNNDGKVDLADLALLNNLVPANIRADVNSDGIVDSKDITFFNTFVGTSLGDEYVPADDMNADGKVDATDIELYKTAYSNKQ